MDPMPSDARRSLAVAVWGLTTAFLVVACGAAGGSPAGSPRPSIAVSSPSASPAASNPAPSASGAGSGGGSIVGEWIGVHDCDRIVAMLHDAGADEFIVESVVGNGLVPGVDTPAQLNDATHPCVGAVEQQHSHFFTADGKFGSKDYNAIQVDDGTYELKGTDQVVINGSTFTYHVDGDTLTLDPEPVDVSACTDKECRFEAAWVLMVAMPGTTWTRGTITP